MIQDLFDIFVYYWPKLLVGLCFAFFNNYIFAKYGTQRKHLLKNFIVLFFISSGFLSVVGEFIFTNIYCKLTDALSYSDSNGFLLFAICMLGDTLMVFIGGNLYTAYTGNREFLGATIYLEYVCVERLAPLWQTPRPAMWFSTLFFKSSYFWFRGRIYHSCSLLAPSTGKEHICI